MAQRLILTLWQGGHCLKAEHCGLNSHGRQLPRPHLKVNTFAAVFSACLSQPTPDWTGFGENCHRV